MQERTSEESASAGPVNAVASQPISTANPSVPQPTAGKVGRRFSWLRRFFLLDERIANVKRAGLSSDKSGWREFETAREAREALSRLSELRLSNGAVLTLRRAEALGLIHATMRRRGVDYSGEHLTPQDWANAASIPEIRDLLSRFTDLQRAVLEAALGEGGQSYLLQLDAAGRRRAARTLGRTAQQLIGTFTIDWEKIERLRFLRWLRIGPVLLVLLVLLVLALRWFNNYQQRSNLAFHRAVTVSSRVDVTYRNPGHLVDGNVTNTAFHTTNDDPNPWAMIDLGSVKSFSKVVVYNRVDCCKERQVPMVVEVSTDGVAFERLAERQVTFDVWTAKNLHATGRYVRVRLEGTGYFHLAEVEIFP